MGVLEIMSFICSEVKPEMTKEDVRALAEQLFPCRMGQNNHIRIRSQGEYCLEQLKKET